MPVRPPVSRWWASQWLMTGWLPLSLWSLHRYAATCRLRYLLACTAAFLIAALTAIVQAMQTALQNNGILLPPPPP